jgi:single-strand DNA-binding protein
MYNQCILIGRLGADAEMNTTQGGQDVTNFNLATSEKWKDRDGTPQERTEWHRIVVWGALAKACSSLKKGALVHVVGRIQSRSFEHNGTQKHITEIKAEVVTFLERGERGDDSKQSSGLDYARSQAKPKWEGGKSKVASSDGLPF